MLVMSVLEITIQQNLRGVKGLAKQEKCQEPWHPDADLAS